jgi:uncharacterized protein
MPMSSDDPASAVARAAEAIRAAGVCDGPDAGINERLAAVGLVDHHVHGIVRHEPDATALADILIESDRRSATEAAGHDTQVWHAVRRWCAPLLGLPPSAPANEYVARRLALGNDAVAAALLPATGLSRLIVETGFRGDVVGSPAALGAAAGAPASRVVRLEALAEGIIAALPDPWTYPDAFRAALAAELAGADPAVGWKTILAYRGGFDRDLGRPDDESVARAAAAWSAEVQGGAPARLADDVLLRFGIWAAVDTGRPLQVHTGFGDPDLDLQRADPLLLTGFLRATEGRASILLLHTYPFQRGAGYLAQMYPHVYLDVGLAINYAGAASTAIVRESMELAPFTKLLFSSDAWGAPELHLLGSWLFRRSMARLLGDWVARGDWSRADAERVIELVASENARRVYALPA